uniref:Uncharacterized protein n=1 Tax=Magallana gigas TaxID=29159 RepID=K1QSH9_MAGGI
MADKQAPMPKLSTGYPVIYKKEYIMEVLKRYENDKNYEQAFQEYKDLKAAKVQLSSNVTHGIPSLGPVVPFKEEKREVLRQSTPDGQGGGEKTTEITQDVKGSDYVDSQNGNLQNSADSSQQFHAELAPIDPVIDGLPTELSPPTPAEATDTTKADEQSPKGKEKQILTLFELLNKEDNKDSEEFEEAQQDLVHMFTCHAVLRSSFPHAVSSDLRWFNLLGPPKSL